MVDRLRIGDGSPWSARLSDVSPTPPNGCTTLTGETCPVEKQSGVLPADTQLAKRSNALFQGTHVVSGTASALVITVGDQTQFGKISERLQLRPRETDFERGIQRVGFFLMEATLLLVVAIFAINVFFHKPVIEAFPKKAWPARR